MGMKIPDTGGKWMAGRGFAPKSPERRARTNRDPVPSTVLVFVSCAQPELPARMPTGDVWPTQTRSWWAMWGASAIAGTFTASDWSELLDTALLHAKLWSGDVRVAAELRLRVAKFGATPEDRARLRITFAQADDADAKRPTTDAREMYGDLRAVDSVNAG